MRVLVADHLPDRHLEALRARHEVTVWDRGTDLAAAVAGQQVLIVRSTRVGADIVEAGDDLALVIRAGAGVNTIDWRAAANRGVYVCNTPGKNAVAVAELTMGLILALDRRIPDTVADARAGRWRKSEYAKAAGLAGRTLGIIGFGEIGMEVARRAGPFHLRLVTVRRPSRSDRQLEMIEELGISEMDLDDLLAAADIVTLHVPANDDTVGMVSAGFLARLKPGAFLVNTSRGDCVDEAALLAAIDEKRLRVGVDVLAGEPTSGKADLDSPLARHPNVYVTHHIGASTDQAQGAIADEVVAIVDDFSRGVVRNCVNLDAGPDDTVVITVRHHNRVGVLARVLGILRGAGLNVQQMANRVLAGAEAATATIHVHGELTAETVDELRVAEDVIGVSVSGPWR